jgi:predicted transcriptional regulator
MVSAPEHERRERGGLESEVMAALAAGDRPMTPREVQAELAGDLAYTTVMTTLARLHDKGALRRRRDGRAYSYRLAGTSDDVTGALTARRMRRVLDAGGDRTVALTAFVSELGPDDERLLSMLLAKIEDETEPER